MYIYHCRIMNCKIDYFIDRSISFGEMQRRERKREKVEEVQNRECLMEISFKGKACETAKGDDNSS